MIQTRQQLAALPAGFSRKHSAPTSNPNERDFIAEAKEQQEALRKERAKILKKLEASEKPRELSKKEFAEVYN